MKILYLVDSLDFGGVQSLVKYHFENQQTNENIFLYALRKCENNIEIRHKNITLNVSKSRYSPWPITEIKSLIKKNNINVLHCYLFRSYVFGWIIKLVFCRKIKLIYHEQGTIFGSETNSKLFHSIYKLFLSLAQYKTDKIIAISTATKKRLIASASIDVKKITIIYNCIDLNIFDSKNKKDALVNGNREKMGFSPKDFVISFAGRLIERKGWEIFLKAAVILKHKTHFKFLIAGNGADKNLLLDYISRHNLSGAVRYYGYCSDMVGFYQMSDCFVVPSHWEPQGLVELEAQALKIPVIAADVEALNEIITDNSDGLLFNVSNAEDLANKIEVLKSNIKLRGTLIENGALNAQKYSISSYIYQLENLYHGIF